MTSDLIYTHVHMTSCYNYHVNVTCLPYVFFSVFVYLHVVSFSLTCRATVTHSQEGSNLLVDSRSYGSKCIAPAYENTHFSVLLASAAQRGVLENRKTI